MKRKKDDSGEFSLFGKDIFGEPVKQIGGIMQQRYIFPPFTVLDGRLGPWLDRKRVWISLGIKSELGRESIPATAIRAKGGGSPDIRKKFESAGIGVSIFDPVLCELMYSWFCPPGGQVVDPFAGGSVRGIIAALLGFKYWGCDLSFRQIEENKIQAQDLCGGNKPVWICGDSLKEVKKAPEADFIFTCPPYADLEVYSNDPRDLSNMDYPAFLESYKGIIANCYEKLKEDRFACFVVGDVRDKKGYYRGLVADTINVFRDCGFQFYNDVVLINPAGSLSIRAGNSFNATRKLGKMHQNVLIFVKGNPRIATQNITNLLKEEENENK